MIVRHVVVGVFQENSWVAVCEETREAILIDPGDETERIVELVDALDANPVRILNTHAHLDHLGAVAELKRRYGIPFGLGQNEKVNLDRLPDQAAPFGLDPPERPDVDHFIVDGEVLTFGKLTLTAIDTPGHTPGGISYLALGRVFVGDTLFLGSIGRVDFPGGDFPTLRHSIRERLFKLPDDTIVHSGHGPDTTIGRERAGNPFVGDGVDPSLTGF